MFFFKWLFTFLQRCVSKGSSLIVFAGYNEYTICKYFRKHGAQIGEGCYIGTRELGSSLFLVSLGNHVWISGDVVFHDHDGGTWVLREKTPHIDVFGPIIIEDNCIIGRRAQLLPNIRIGKNSIIGAGSVVISDIPPNSIAMGVPARVIGSVTKYEEKCLARWKEQTPPDLDMKNRREAREITKKHLMDLFNKERISGEETTHQLRES
jgi:acetyltransferase-like isoleucine patch superfamily enzyme